MDIELLRKSHESNNIFLNKKNKNAKSNEFYEENKNEKIINTSSDINSINNNSGEREKKELTGEENVKVAINVFGNYPDINVLASGSFLPKPSQNFQKTNNLPKRLPKRTKKNN